MIAIIDYGMGNLRSVQKALEHAGAETTITHNAEDIEAADKVVLPGVGAMRPAMQKLEDLGLVPLLQSVINSGKPFLGICLGLQLLFEKSNEGGEVKGLGFFKGTVERFAAGALKVPHMGWNQLNIKNTDGGILGGIDPLSYVYFCHSYFVKPRAPEIVAATTDYGGEFVCAVAAKNVYGVQFHPEKSQKVGLKILERFNSL